MIFKNRFGLLFLILASAAILNAAPKLALTQTAFSVPVAAGANGPTQIVDTANTGDGALSLQTSSSVTWLAASLGAQHSCSLASVCMPVQIALQTSALAKGTYTGVVTISDPNAVDAPQFVTVTVQIGGSIPDKLEFFLPPGGSASSSFTTAGKVTTGTTGGPWLSIAVDGNGTFQFNVPYKVTATALMGMGVGDSNGSVALTGATPFSPDNKTFPVVMHITTQPIIQASTSTVQFRVVQGSTTKLTTPVPVSNGGQGTLSISGVTATAATGTWLSAASVNNGAAIGITADPTGLSANTYLGTVTVASNAANGSVTIPVQLVVAAQSAPVAFVGGAVNNGTFASREALAQGDIAAVFGDQFTLGDPQLAGSVPLPKNLAGTQVFVNDLAAPLYFTSAGQIDFQVPFEVPRGPAVVRVDRNGQRGNSISVTIAAAAPRFILLNGGPYAIMTTPDAVLTGIPTHPAKSGDVVVIYTIGFGQTSPPVQTGAAAPADPLAVINGVQVCFRPNLPVALENCNDAAFAGLSPGFVGLYQ
ncbi:MAG TPA: hypothetical protein VIX89_18210, partial [Bryobacteraceae bacterium]